MSTATLSPVELYMLGHVRPEPDLDIGPPPADLVRWLAASAIPLASAEPDAPSQDLVPLRAIIGDARVVGMGEATHGTAEFFTLKHRLFKFLVEEVGFTTLAVESGFAESLAIGAYVRGGPLPSFAGQHPELIDLIEWMRERNSSGRHPQLTFVGFDMQSPTAAIAEALAVARRLDPTIDRAASDLAPLGSSFGASHYRAAPESARRRVQRGLANLQALLGASRGTHGDDDVAIAALLVRSAQWAERYSFFPTQRARDEAMAAMVMNVLGQGGPKTKIALWAHNAHIERGELVELVGAEPVPTMGRLLHERLAAGYVAISFAFDRGSFRAQDLLGGGSSEFTVSAAPAETLDGALAAAGHTLAAFPLRGAPEDNWLASRPGARRIGGASTDHLAELSFVRADPRVSADLVVFVRETTAARETVPGESEHQAPIKPIDAPDASSPNLGFQDVQADGCPRGWELRAPAGEGSVKVDADALMLSRRGSPDGAAWLVHRIAIDGDKSRTVVVRAVLASEAGPWPGGAHLTLRYDSHAPVDVQLAHPPFALSPTFPTGDDEWHEVQLGLELPATVRTIEVGLCVVGNGSAKLRSLSIAVTESPVGSGG